MKILSQLMWAYLIQIKKEDFFYVEAARAIMTEY